MTTVKTIQIAPLNKTIIVKASQAKAFDVFTNGIDRWWPKSHGIGSAAVVQSIIEPGVGGRWYTKHADGTEAVVGHMRVWEPPSRIVFGWEISAVWKPDANVSSEVEVKFIAEGPNATRIELEHRNFENMGKEAGEKMRSDVGGGWPTILELYKQVAEA